MILAKFPQTLWRRSRPRPHRELVLRLLSLQRLLFPERQQYVLQRQHKLHAADPRHRALLREQELDAVYNWRLPLLRTW